MPLLSRRRKSSSGSARGKKSPFWLLLVIFFVALAGTWLWWSFRPAPTAKNESKVVIQPNLTNAPSTVAATTPALKPAQSPTVPIVSNVVKTSLPTLILPAVQVSSDVYPRPPRDTVEAQIALARFGVSPGSIDGALGSQTRAAVAAFQKKMGIPATGELDTATRTELLLTNAPMTTYIVTSNDLARLQPLSKSWLGKSQQSALDFETILEFVAEQGHASPTLVRRLNPGINWSNVVAGTEIRLPKAEYPKASTRAAFVIISLSEKQLQAFDAETNLLAHFPCSIAARFEKRPVGELHITSVVPGPDYTFKPDVFPESEEARKGIGKLLLPPGPNNPVGTAWMGLDKPSYGIHGTPNPEQVGRTESRGCFRLANWNADFLVKIAWVGMPVYVLP